MNKQMVAQELLKLAKELVAGGLYEMDSMHGGIDLIRVGLNKQTITISPVLYSGGRLKTWKKVLSDEVFQALDDVGEEAGLEQIISDVKKLAVKFDDDVKKVFEKQGFKL